MKACKYCGRENDDHAAHCGDCGGSEFKSKAPDTIPESVSAVQPAPVTPEALIGVAKGPLITRITCRTPQEANLVIMELESAGIIGIVENEVVQEAGVSSIADRQIPVLTSTKAYEAASELHAAREARVWFARGLALWVLGGVLVWAALAVLR